MERGCLSPQSALEAGCRKKLTGQSDELYRRLTFWHTQHDAGEDLPDVQLNDLELGWRAWTLGEALGWQMLPFAGGYLEQPEALMEDILTIAALSRRVKEHVNAGKRS
jgi:hypothetical protein